MHGMRRFGILLIALAIWSSGAASAIVQFDDETIDNSLTSVTSPFAAPKVATTEWALAAGYQSGGTLAAGVVIPSGVADSGNGDLYVTGMLLYEAVFGQTRNNGQDQVGFVAKASASGQWSWLKTQQTHAGGGFSSYTSIEVSGNDIYACGWYVGNITMGSDQHSSANDEQDIFVVKMNQNGDVDWSAVAGGSGDDEACNDIVIDSNGDIFALGEFNASTTATFGSHALNGAGATDVWVAKLSSSGAWQWATRAGGQTSDYGSALVHTGSGLIATGTFTGTADFGSNQMQSIGQGDLWIAHVSTTGAWSNANQAGATGGLVQAFGIVEDNGTAYVSGDLVGTANFGSIQASSSNNGQDRTAVVAAIGPNQQWSWVTTAVGYTTGRSIDLQDGLLLISGSFASVSSGQYQQTGSSTFGSTTLPANYDEGYAAIMDTSGNWLSAEGSQGSIREAGIQAVWRTQGTIALLGTFCGGGLQSGGSCTATVGNQQVSATGEFFSENYGTPGGVFLWSMQADSDGDNDPDVNDNCPSIHNPNQEDIDSDSLGDACDPDIDEDGILNEADDCDGPATHWDPTDPSLDRDGDGCRDSDEDMDDDADGILDASDLCDDPGDEMNWSSTRANDHDEDGCHDQKEDDDDDNDGIGDLDGDMCARGWWNWTSDATTDHDSDGCADNGEDKDDDNDSVLDVNENGESLDLCPRGDLDWISTPATDRDGDGCRDEGEDQDDDADGVDDDADGCNNGAIGWNSSVDTDIDGDGCRDADEDNDDDGDGVLDDNDGCAQGMTGWTSSNATDLDGDGCADLGEDVDDDADGIPDLSDSCPRGETNWSATSDQDADSDGCRDATEDSDDDGDGVDDSVDACLGTPKDEPVSDDGCGLYTQQDGDDDGVYDLDDDCLDTPSVTERTNPQYSQWGEKVDGFGCWSGELDEDEDGKMNFLDFCPNTPPNTIPDPLGCIPGQYDLDEDGVEGDRTGADQCLDTSNAEIRDAHREFGTVDNVGCWPGDFDTDGDSFPAYIDRCAGTNAGAPVNTTDEARMGCADHQLDDDDDGVTNDVDQCRATPLDMQVNSEGEFAGCSLDERLEAGDFAAMTEAYGVAMGGGAVLIVILISLLVLMLARRGGEDDPYASPQAASFQATPLGTPASLDPYVQQLIDQGYTAEVAQAAAANYNEHSHGVQAAAGPPPAGASQAATYAQDYTKLPSGGDYQTDMYGTTTYHAPDGSQWRMNPDQSFDRL